MNKVCNIDTKEVKELFQKLNEENRKKAGFKAIVKGGQSLVEKAREELVKSLPNAARGNKYGEPMSKGIKLKKYRDENEVLVHILGDYRLKFFELGTDDRYLKKPLPHKETSRYKYKSGTNNTGGTPYRGKIKALGFFADTLQKENEIINEIENTLIKEINKLLK